MKYLVVYDSYFGNTETIAKEIATTLDDCECVRVTDINFREKVDLLIVGSPTRGFKATASIQKFLNSLPSNVKNVALFDTRIDTGTISSGFSRWIIGNMGYANNKMIKIVLKRKRNIIEPIEFFYVLGNEGPLKEGEIDKAKRWAESLKIIEKN